MKKLRLITIYLGGFIGPFAGQSIAVILPNVAESFSITLEQAALTMSAYLFPFATVMLGSTRIVRRFRPRRVILTAYLFTLVGSAICILSPTWIPFLLGFMVMGVANAFTLPIFQVMLRQLMPPNELGAALGTYAAMQSLGLFSAPLIAGVATLVNWQLMFGIVFVGAVWVLIVQVPDVLPPSSLEESSPGRILWGPTLVHMISCLMIGFGIIGVAILTALSVGDRFGVDSVGRGLVIMSGGLAAFVLAASLGKLADVLGPKRVLLGSIAVGSAALFLVSLVPSLWLVAACWAFAILAAQGMQTCINLVVLRSPGGVSILSSVQAFRFYGSSITPLVLLPVYLQAANWAFWIPALGLLGILILQTMNPIWRHTGS